MSISLSSDSRSISSLEVVKVRLRREKMDEERLTSEERSKDDVSSKGVSKMLGNSVFG